MENDWVTIYSTENTQSLIMVKAMLETNDIDAIEMNKQDSGYMIGDMELLVRRENAVRAKYLIDKSS